MREVTVAWDRRPRVPVEEVLRAAGVLESRTLERRGKWWLGQWLESLTELSWLVWDAEVVWSPSRRRPVSHFLTASLFAAPELLREVRLLSSGRVCIERRRWDGSRHPRESDGDYHTHEEGNEEEQG
ncbi:hypothetical protein Taro_003651 [Colocasia esculenta]|uniref:Uncharacterized protein n=1 Tax=Colocasia esculenta TaxID=4460 RepID=A0A843THS2_COLES|nr:hypothetical protein [Colocasia esculenta]